MIEKEEEIKKLTSEVSVLAAASTKGKTITFHHLSLASLNVSITSNESN
jgi:hypothetical protein